MSDISKLREWANNRIKLYDKMAVEAPHLYASDVSRSMLHQVVELCDKMVWKYPSKGEYPPNSKWVFVYLNDDTATVGSYCSWAELKWIDNYENAIYSEDIVAWQYIIPPKENEK